MESVEGASGQGRGQAYAHHKRHFLCNQDTKRLAAVILSLLGTAYLAKSRIFDKGEMVSSASQSDLGAFRYELGLRSWKNFEGNEPHFVFSNPTWYSISIQVNESRIFDKGGVVSYAGQSDLGVFRQCNLVVQRTPAGGKSMLITFLYVLRMSSRCTIGHWRAAIDENSDTDRDFFPNDKYT
ncbi:hypothetical protein AVEN_130824-1 [Araneus ventricosus]|uniref:Uncharacterized protein n=1 Tax=Araneus ventricosus TaxID=182803 RepID=A0A4Y2JTR2_ARAVE|nr:hypothetical protein AVEN_130824-1 [Araneus ventricosus]